MNDAEALEPVDTAAPEPSEPARRRRFSPGQFLLSCLIVLGAVLIYLGVFGSVTGRDQSNLPDEIERIEPSLGDNVLNQANIVVDLAAGYGGRLLIDGVALPTESTQESEPGGQSGVTPNGQTNPNAVRFDAGTNTLSFQPRPGADLERFDVGRHVAQVIYWKLVDGEAVSFSYTWYFEVTA